MFMDASSVRHRIHGTWTKIIKGFTLAHKWHTSGCTKQVLLKTDGWSSPLKRMVAKKACGTRKLKIPHFRRKKHFSVRWSYFFPPNFKVNPPREFRSIKYYMWILCDLQYSLLTWYVDFWGVPLWLLRLLPLSTRLTGILKPLFRWHIIAEKTTRFSRMSWNEKRRIWYKKFMGALQTTSTSHHQKTSEASNKKIFTHIPKFILWCR